MPLKFPNVRLFLFDLLTYGGLSGPEAIARTAVEYGIIPLESINDVLKHTSLDESCLCHCVDTLKNVLHKHFAIKAQQSGLPAIDADEVWQSIHIDAMKHHKLAPLVNSDHKCGANTNSSNCLGGAPALFDLLLQHIRRYP